MKSIGKQKCREPNIEKQVEQSCGAYKLNAASLCLVFTLGTVSKTVPDDLRGLHLAADEKCILVLINSSILSQ